MSLDKAQIRGYLKKDLQEYQDIQDICNEWTLRKKWSWAAVFMAKILLVEDDRNLANLTKVALCAKGHEVMVFYGALKAIEEAKQQNPDLILMDIMLPEISGPEAVRELRKDKKLAKIPVIFLTGLIGSQEEDVEHQGLNIDGINYKILGKPYEMAQLLELVGSVPGGRKKQ